MRRMFKKVLVANRGEIAVRICKTLRKMGIRSVVVASIPDRRSLAVRSADAWALLEGYSAAESYLDIDAVIAAAKAEGCEAIHPGYGFLSERADFAARCAAEGIVFIGPPPEVLRGLGDKAAARQLAVSNGVPVVPGWDGADDPETLIREAARIGYPVMLKARGGGGGRGMREVFAPDELPEAIESARREALTAFGDGGLLLEKLVTSAHHVEVQVLADTHGNVIHLGERDCSVQRRHQKLIEETPSPVVDAALRERLTGYALTLARAINYVNAGTFEFLVSPVSPSPASEGSRERGPGGEGWSQAEVYFLEVNPRLQVEHPVTEMVTGLDLVELQLRIAAGEPLPMTQDDVEFSGHAIEFRINAEDPWDNFKPSSGRVRIAFQETEHRLDAGYETGDQVPSAYDSLLGKDIVWRESRAEVLSAVAADGIGVISLESGRNNALLLQSIANSEAFSNATAHVGWLESALPRLGRSEATLEQFVAAAAFGLVHQKQSVRASRVNVPISVWAGALWLGAGNGSVWLDAGNDAREVRLRWNHDGGGRAVIDGVEFAFTVREAVVSIELGKKYRPYFNTFSDVIWVSPLDSDEESWSFNTVPPPPLPRRAHAAAEGATAILAPLPGSIAAVRVAEGDSVEAGQLLLVLEAMKMEHRISAPAEGTVKSVNVRERDQVREGDVLVELG